jgi:hypothetical protein
VVKHERGSIASEPLWTCNEDGKEARGSLACKDCSL